MSDNDEIFEFLTQPENLKVAIEVANYVNMLKEKTHRQFWVDFNNQVEQKRLNSGFQDTWKFVQFPLNRLKTEWQKSYLAPNYPKEFPHTFLQFSFAQGVRQNNYRLWRGVSWNSQPKDFKHPKLAELNHLLLAKNITNPEYLWVRWDYYSNELQLEGEGIISRMAQDATHFLQEMVDDFWQLFIELKPIVEEINQIVAVKSTG